MIPSIEGCKGSTQVSFTRTSTQDFYINLLVKKGGEGDFTMEYEDGTIWAIPAGWFTQVPNTPIGDDEWMYLDRTNNQFNNAQSPGVPVNEVTTIKNNNEIFQMGLYNGNSSGGCKYGYFSDFKNYTPDAVAADVNSDLTEACFGDTVTLWVNSKPNLWWTTSCSDCILPPIDSTYVNLIPPPGVHKFYAEIDHPCLDTTAIVNVTVGVDSLVQAYFDTDDPLTACDSINISTNNKSIGATNGYSWLIGDSLVATTENTIFQHTNTSSTPDTLDLRLIALRTCVDEWKRTAIVYPKITADFAPADTSGCSPMPIDFINQSTAGTNTYKWDFDDGDLAFTDSTSHIFQNTLDNDTVFNVSLMATSQYNCKDTASKTIRVFPELEASFSTNKIAGCAPLEIDVTNLSTLAKIDSTQWVWGDGDTTKTTSPGSHIYQNTSDSIETKTLYLEVFSDSGCSTIDSIDITVYPQVISGFEQDLLSICDSSIIAFTDTSSGAISSKKWIFGDGVTLSNVSDTTHIYRNLTNDSITLTVKQIVKSTQGCTDTTTNTVTVQPRIQPVFNADVINGCADLTISLTNNSNGPISNYTWNWGDGSPIVTDPVPNPHTYVNDSNIIFYDTIQLVVENIGGCTKTARQPIEVYPRPDSTFITDITTGCNQLTVEFTHTPSLYLDVTRTWDFDDGITDSDSTLFHTFMNTGDTAATFNTTLTVETSRGCTTIDSTTITVAPYLKAQFEIDDTLKKCSPFVLNITNNSLGGIDNYTWQKNGITFSTDSAPAQQIFYNHSDTAVDTTITLIISNSGGSCTKSISKTITIYPEVTADYTPDTETGCNPHNVQFTYNPFHGGMAVTYDWDFGDTTYSSTSNPVHTYTNTSDTSRVFYPQLTIESEYGCSISHTDTITVYPEINAAFDVDGINKGCSPFVVTLNNNSSGGIEHYYWSKIESGAEFDTTSTPGTLTFINKTSSKADTTIRLVVENIGGCSDTIERTVTIYPEVDATFGQDTIIGCNPLTVNLYHNPSQNVPVTRLWEFGDSVTASDSTTSHTYINLADTTRTFTTQLFVESQYECRDTFQRPTQVYPYINAEFSLNNHADDCSPFTLDLTNNSAGGISSYTWKKENSVFSSIADPEAPTLYNTDTVPVDTTISLIIENIGGCLDSIQRNVTIYPEVDASFTHDVDTGCTPLLVNFNHTPTHPGINVNTFWEFGDTATAVSANTNHTYTNLLDSLVTFAPSLLVTSDYGCTDTVTDTIAVYSYVKSQFSLNKTKGCSPLTISFTNNSEGGISQYQWLKNDIPFANIEAPTAIKLHNTGTTSIDTTIYLVVSNGNCTDTMQQNVTIYPEVDAAFTQDTIIGCNPLAVQFQHSSPIANIDWLWEFGDTTSSSLQNPGHTFENFADTTRTYNIQLIVSSINGCTDTSSQVINVYPKINASFSVDNNASGCSPFGVSLTNNSTGGLAGYSWMKETTEFDTTATPGILTLYNTDTLAVDTTIMLIVENSGGCTDTATREVTIYPEVDAGFTHDTAGCTPFATSFNFDPIHPEIDVDMYWEFGDTVTSSLENPTHLYTNSTSNTHTFNPVLNVVSEYGCTATDTSSIEIYAYVDAQFSIDSTTKACSPFTVQLTNNASGGIADYTWNTQNSTISDTLDPGSPVFYNTGILPVDSTITLIVSNAQHCADTIQKNVTIYPEVDASFVPDIDTGCNALTVNFSPNPKHSEINVSSFWEFGDSATSVDDTVAHTYTNLLHSLVTFNPKLLVTSDYGCTDTVTDTIAVYSYVKSQFSLNKTKGCSPLTISFTNNSEGGITQYEWLKNDIPFANIEYPTAITLYNTGTTSIDTTIYLVVSNGNCTDTMQQNVTIYPEVDAAFTQDTIIGCDPLTVQFQHSSPIANIDWFWEFGDTTSSSLQNPGHTFENFADTTRTYNTQLIVSSINGCTDTSSQVINVYPKINASFSVNNDASGCSPFGVSLTNNSTGGLARYSWMKETTEFDTTATPGILTLHNTDTLPVDTTIFLVVQNIGGCTDTATREVTIFPEVDAGFTHDTAGCTPFTTSFNFDPIHPEIDVDMYWEFGDTVTSSLENPTHLYTNSTSNSRTFNPVLNVVSEYGCAATDTSSIEVYAFVDAQFSIDSITKACSPFTVQLTNNASGGIADYTWNTQNSTISDTLDPGSPVFYNTGILPVDSTITLIVSNAQHCADTIQKNVTIYPEVDASFVPDAAGCNPLAVQFYHTPIHPEINVSAYWDFGDTVTSSEPDPLHLYNHFSENSTIYKPILNVVSDYGCSAIDSTTIEVYPYIEAQFSIDSVTKGCSPFSVSITNHSIGGIAQYKWMKNGIVFDSVQNPAAITLFNTDTVPVDTTITLVVANANNCTDTLQRTVTIYPEVDASFTPDTAGCNPLSVQFHHTPIHPEIEISAYWDFGDTVTSSEANPVHLFENRTSNTAIFSPTLKVVSKHGCTAIDSSTIEVYPYIEAQFSIDSVTKGCSPFSVSITNHSIGGIAQYKWMKNGIAFDSAQNPAAIALYNTGTIPVDTTITLVVANLQSCTDTIHRAVTIYPEVDASFTPDTAGCNPLAVQFHHTPIHPEIDVNTYWDFGDTVTSSDANPYHIYENRTSNTANYSPTLSVVSEFGCSANYSSTVQVYPYIEAKFSIDNVTKGCSPFQISFTNHSIGGVSNYRWYKNDILFSNQEKPSPITLYNRDATTVDTTITLVVLNPDQCTDTLQRIVKIYPEVDANFTTDVNNGCTPLSVNFNHEPIHDIFVNWDWDFGDTVGSTLENPIHIYDNQAELTEYYTPQLNVKSIHGCTDSASQTIEVFSYVDAQFSIVGDAQGCSPFTLNFVNDSKGDILEYTWKKNDIVFSSQQTPSTITLYNKGINPVDTAITLIITNEGGCIDSIKRIVTIYPEVDANFITDITEGCNPLTVNFTHAPTHPEIDVTWNWTFGNNSSSEDENPTNVYNHRESTAQNYLSELHVESEFGCSHIHHQNITVAAFIDAAIAIEDPSGCSPRTVNMTNYSSGGITSYNWRKNDNTFSTTSGSPDLDFTNQTNYTIIDTINLIVQNDGPGNCYDTSMRRIVTTYPEVTADFMVDTNRGCNPVTINFSFSPGSNTVTVIHDWTFGDNSSSDNTNPNHEYINESYNSTAAFEVVHNTISINGCTAEQKDTITVEKALEALINADPAAGCHPYNANFTNSTKGADTYTWVFGDGETTDQYTQQDISHLYTNTDYNLPITREAYLISTNGGGSCIDTSQIQNITIYPDILASFIPDNFWGCHPFTINFTNNTLGADSYYWDFDDQTNTTDQEPSHTFINFSSTVDSTFDVHLTATSEYYCTDDTIIAVTSYHEPSSEFDIDYTSSCNPLNIVATNEAVGYTTFEWRLGTGDTVSNESPLETQYTNTGNDVLNYELELYTESNQGCKDSSSLVLNVYPNVTAQFSISPDSSCNPVVASFTNTSINADFSYWLFGDGTTSNLENPTNRYEITGATDQVITAKLISSSQYNCIDSTTREITIFVQPDADFEIDPVTQTFPSSTIVITDLTNVGPFAYSWDYGDDNTSENDAMVHNHSYETWGPYEVKLNVNNQNFECKDSTSNLLIIDPPIVFATISTADTAGCEPHTVNLKANDPIFADETYTYLWDFGDGSSSTNQNPTYTYDTAGNYRITLMVIGSSGESATSTIIITVYDNPEIDFTMSPRLVMIPDDYVQCYNFTKYGSEYFWDFGDGNTSEDENPAHYYAEPGFYDVYMKATSIHGCVSDTTREQYIEVRGQAVLEFPNAFSPTGPSDGRYNETDIDNDIFHPVWEGVVEFDLYIYNRWGELMFHSDDVNIGWDGHYNNKLCPQDVYIWKAEGKFINGDTFEKSGDVTLLR